MHKQFILPQDRLFREGMTRPIRLQRGDLAPDVAVLKHAQRYCPLLSPSATCVLGLGTAAHQAYGLQRGALGQLAGPQVIAAGLRAAAHGFHQGASTGDVQMLSGTFVVDQAGRVRYAFYSSDAGEHPDLVSLLDERYQEATAS